MDKQTQTSAQGQDDGRRKKWILSIRTTADSRRRLTEAAEEAGRSLTQEMESRLERSFQTDDTYGGPANAAFAGLIGALLREIDSRHDASWLQSLGGWKEARNAIVRLLEERKPQRPTSADARSSAEEG